MNNVKLRMANVEDAKELLAIYAPYVEETSISFEYVVPSVEEFKKRIENTLKNYPYIVAETDGKILGYAYASRFKERAAYTWGVETSIYVKRDNRQGGIGRILYETLEEILMKQNVLNINACITYPNPDSIAFHERMGFKKTAHFHKCGYKLGEWHDMIWMEKFVGKHSEDPMDLLPINEVATGF